MRTDDLIHELAGRLEPVSSQTPTRHLIAWVACSGAVSALVVLVSLGLRPDFVAAAGGPMLWTKFGYTLGLGVLALWAAERLGRPGAKADRPALAVLALIGLFAAVALVRFAAAPPQARHHLLMGHSAMFCPWLILILSIPVLVGALAAMRSFAPTRPTLAGFAAGLGAGGVAAFVYAFSCNETAMPFVAVWYTLPMLVAGGIGAVAGRWLLRW